MPASHEELWQRIEQYTFDRPDDNVTFIDKLCREHGWTAPFARAAIEEYRRFAFLAVASGHSVSPPDAIDQVWHMHLMYSRRYWDDFCKGVLQTTLHHEPATGRPGERGGLADDYTHTLTSYRKHFGEPPATFWPARPYAAPRSHRRVDLRSNVVLPTRIAVWLAVLFGILCGGVGAVVMLGVSAR